MPSTTVARTQPLVVVAPQTTRVSMLSQAVIQEAKRAGDARFAVETGAFSTLGR